MIFQIWAGKCDHCRHEPEWARGRSPDDVFHDLELQGWVCLLSQTIPYRPAIHLCPRCADQVEVYKTRIWP